VVTAPDLRAALLAAGCWAGALAGFLLARPALLGGLALGLGVAAAVAASRKLRPRTLGPTALAGLLAVVAVAGMASMRADAHRLGVVGRLAEDRAPVRAELVLRGDPVVREGRFGAYVVARAETRQVTTRGRTVTTLAPVLLLGEADGWSVLRMGARLEVRGRLAPPRDDGLAGVLRVGAAPDPLAEPSWPFRAAEQVRDSIRRAVEPASPEARALVPALVVGDDTAMSPEVVDSFAAAGLTHLTAVSGTNLTLVVGSLLLLARWCGIRARGLVVVGLLGVVGFVLLARPEPSVLRAAAMGSVALLGFGSGGPSGGLRVLGGAVGLLLLVDPWLATSVGFSLSALATAGILVLAPWFADALSRWLPHWVALAVAVPAAAQLACTPLVAAVSEQVSVVAVAANLLAAPAVGPATVLGLAAGLVGLVSDPLGRLVARPAGWCADWVVTVATRSAALPGAALDWSVGATSLAVLTVGCVAAALLAPRLLRRRGWTLAAVAVLVLSLLRPAPTPGWPPSGWVMVACDVGQGDGLVLAAGPDEAVVVDAGPEPKLMDRCLDRLGVHRVPAVVLTHFHADHVDGLPGVLDGRPVGEVEVTGTRDPAYGAAAVEAWAREAGVRVRVPEPGETVRVGDLSWQVVGPGPARDGGARADGAGEEGSTANDASLVLLVRSHGVTLLLTGDVEPDGQRGLLRALPAALGGAPVDVLKVPHHGSRFQDSDLLAGLGARLAVVSAGADNDYGHPAGETLARLERGGALVRRTDLDGDVAVVVRDGELRVVTRT
jgi:competence protein ComEC